MSNSNESLSPQDIADDILGTAENQRHASEVMAGFIDGMQHGLMTWDAEQVEDDARRRGASASIEYRKGWAIGQAMGVVKRTSEGKIKLKMS